MDESYLPDDHPLHSNANKDIIGKFKYEYKKNAFCIINHVALRSKTYCQRLIVDKKVEDKMKGKGTVKAALSDTVTYENYKNVILNKKDGELLKQERFSSRKLKIYTVEEMKEGLKLYDDKNFIADDYNTCRPIGHYLNQICDLQTKV